MRRLAPRAAGCGPSGRRPSWRRPGATEAPRASTSSGSRSSTTRSARYPGTSLPRRRSSPASHAACDRRRLERLLDGDRLLGLPGGPLVDRAQHAGREPGDRVELLDRRVRAVRDHARPSPRASGRRTSPSSRSAQKRSARSRSEGACENCTEQATPSAAKRPTSSGARHCACSIRCRRPSGCHSSRVASNASSASRFARSPIACTRDRPARAGAAPGRSPPAPRRS